ncbi:helix-hairpin-helix domain-containing protein [Paeniglutamicibacter antarcticus]|uniref:Helix-hairpin-helix DNA-binding motif class 1 domain-containing protein n=1 Tax=Paeniglutamicibacter antarcticus TaxID=494023 RepID=A0ABP9TJS9_9MICC
MGSHEWADSTPKAALGPTPGRLRVLVGRSAAIVLILGALTWVTVSLLFNPAPRSPESIERFPLEVSDSAATQQATENPAASESGAAPVLNPAVKPGEAPGKSAPVDLPGGTPQSRGATAVIHMIGAVKKPGVYSLPLGSRVLDAVNLAGGLAKDASAEAINLAAEIRDGEQIRIPHRGETNKGTPSEATPDTAVDASNGPGAPGGALNVNTATQDQLEQLPGIGPTLAGRIIEFRAANGPITNLSELDAVSGIGPALLGNLRERVVFE